MSLRGSTPFATRKKRLLETPTSKAAALVPPEELGEDPEAVKFWQRHAGHLAEADLLSEGDVDSFILLCRIHSHLTALHNQVKDNPKLFRHFLDLTRQYLAIGRQFCLFPKERRQQAVSFGGDMTARHQDKEEFDL